MTQSSCATCGSQKSVQPCGLCDASVCKKCATFVPGDAFSFLKTVPPELLRGRYCPNCFEREVLPVRARYDELMEQAKEVYFLSKAYRGNVRILGRHTKRVGVEACADRRETILRLAFFAAELGMNAIIEAEVECRKVRDGKYQTSVWSGSALPAKIDGERLELSSLRGF